MRSSPWYLNSFSNSYDTIQSKQKHKQSFIWTTNRCSSNLCFCHLWPGGELMIWHLLPRSPRLQPCPSGSWRGSTRVEFPPPSSQHPDKTEPSEPRQEKVEQAFLCWVDHSYGRRVQRLSLQFPGGVNVTLWDLGLKLGRLRLSDLHAVQRTDNLDFTPCRGLKKDVRKKPKVENCRSANSCWHFDDGVKKQPWDQQRTLTAMKETNMGEKLTLTQRDVQLGTSRRHESHSGQ